jgi:hypothetical protein
MLCGKEMGIDPETLPGQELFALCPSCARSWLADYVRRLKARLANVMPGNWF